MNPNQIVPIIAVFMGMLVVLVPVVGITARIALRPIMESWARYRELRGGDEGLQLLAQRVALMEEQLHGMQRSLHRLQEESDFRRQLDSGAAYRPLPGGDGPAG